MVNIIVALDIKSNNSLLCGLINNPPLFNLIITIINIDIIIKTI